MTTNITKDELRAIGGAVGDRRAGEWDENFEGEGDALESAYEKIAHAIGVVRRGGVVLVLTKGELDALRLAAGNSTADPDWYKSWCRTRTDKKNLLSVAEKVGFIVTK